MTNPASNPTIASKSQRRFGFQRQHENRSFRLGLVTVIALLAMAVYGLYWWTTASHVIITNDAYVAGNLTPLRAQTSGTVIEVKVDNTQYVKQGEVLVRLDGLKAQVALEQAEANLANSVRHIETLFNQSDMLRQKLLAKEAIVKRHQRDLVRYQSVAADGVVSAQQIENTTFQVLEQEAEARQIRAELGGADALIQNTTAADNPTVLQAAAALKQAYLDRVRQDIVAPVSGFVSKRSIQPGVQVSPETPLLAIVPLDYLWIEANFLENELAEVKPGQTAEMTVDLYGSAVIYHGKVLGLAAGTGSVFGLLPPDNATGNYIHIVERVPVRIELKAEELQAKPLRPGLSARVRIDISLPGQSVLQPLTTTPINAYKTTVYDRQLDGAEDLISQIIESNRSHRMKPEVIPKAQDSKHRSRFQHR